MVGGGGKGADRLLCPAVRGRVFTRGMAGKPGLREG